MTGARPEDGEARQALPLLTALQAVLADPDRLVALLQEAEDGDQPVRLRIWPGGTTRFEYSDD